MKFNLHDGNRDANDVVVQQYQFEGKLILFIFVIATTFKFNINFFQATTYGRIPLV